MAGVQLPIQVSSLFTLSFFKPNPMLCFQCVVNSTLRYTTLSHVSTNLSATLIIYHCLLSLSKFVVL